MPPTSFELTTEDIQKMTLRDLSNLAEKIGVPHKGLDRAQLVHRILLSAEPIL